MDIELLVNHVYSIELCSGEKRRWKYLGEDDSGKVWWTDQDTGAVFNEESIMYVWTVFDDLGLDLTLGRDSQNVD